MMLLKAGYGMYNKNEQSPNASAYKLQRGEVRVSILKTPTNIVLVAKGSIHWLAFSSTCYMQSFCTKKSIAAFKIRNGTAQQKHTR